MAVTNGNDSAFPGGFVENADQFGSEFFGCTKRELFAAMALQGICASAEVSIYAEDSLADRDIARVAVRHADALIEALNAKR